DTAAMCCDRQQRGVPDLWILRGPVSGLPSPYGAAAVERLSATPDVQAEGTAPSIARAGPFPRVDAPLRQAGILQGKGTALPQGRCSRQALLPRTGNGVAAGGEQDHSRRRDRRGNGGVLPLQGTNGLGCLRDGFNLPRARRAYVSRAVLSEPRFWAVHGAHDHPALPGPAGPGWRSNGLTPDRTFRSRAGRRSSPGL